MNAPPLSPVLLSTFGLRREPPRAPEHREPGYEDKFEYDTLFYDVMLSADGRTVTALGPPLLNCESAVLEGTFRLGEHGPTLTPRHVQHVNGGTTRFDLPRDIPPDHDSQELSITIHGHTARVSIQPADAADFAGKRVLYSMSQDNHPQWIRDWATYHHRLHGANALIVYDNRSTRYTTDQLRDALQDIPGIDALRVIPWNYSFGTGTGPRGEYDSSFGQMGAINHARWRFAERAEACLFLDIDELVLARDGGSIYDALRDSGAPCLTFAGRWVTSVRPTFTKRPPPPEQSVSPSAEPLGARLNAPPPSRHSDCVYQTRQPPYLNKWIAAPGRCDDDAQWLLHCIIGLPEPHDAAADINIPNTHTFEMRHCRPINTNWKYNRTVPQRYLPTRHRYDRPLARALAAAFPTRPIHRATGNPLRNAWQWVRNIR